MWLVRGEFKQVVGFAAHDDDALLLGRREIGREGHRIEEPMQTFVVLVCGGIARCGHDADSDILPEKV